MAKVTVIPSRRPATLLTAQCGPDGRIVRRDGGLLVEGQRC
jgi:hypothetical protein